MKHVEMYVVLLTVGLGFQAVARADEIDKKLQQAKDAHAQAMLEAKKQLLDAFDAEIKHVAANGDLETALALQSQQKEFDEGGVLPQDGRIALAVKTYEAARKAAQDKLLSEFHDAMLAYTKDLQLAKAKEVRDTMEALRQGDSRATNGEQDKKKKTPVARGNRRSGAAAFRLSRAGIPQGMFRVDWGSDDWGEEFVIDGNKIIWTKTIHVSGKIKVRNHKGKVNRLSAGKLLIKFDNGVAEKWTIADTHILIEQWVAESDKQKPPQYIGVIWP